MATPIEEGQTEGKATLLFRSSTRNMSHSTPTRELDQKELVKVTLQRDRYKRDCEYKDKQILEYHEALADKETEIVYQSSVIKELEKQLAAYADAGDDNNSLSEEDTRVRELEEMVGKVEDDKRILVKAQETLQNNLRMAESQLQDKDELIQNLTTDLNYCKVLNKESEKLKDTLKRLEEEMIDTKKIVDELGGELSEKVIEIEDLNDLVAEKEREIVRVKEEITTAAHLAPEEKKQTVKGQVDDLVKKSKMQERQIKGLVEKIQLKEAELAIYKQDFESERNDRQRIHNEYEELKTKTEEARTQHKADKEAMANLAEVMRDQEEEIQVVTAQVNAYSREVDKQKGLVTQSQEKHKTEVNELNERLANELKSKQQLDNKLAMMRQQLTNVSANNEELLRAYNKLKDENEKLKNANIVLKDKVKQQPITVNRHESQHSSHSKLAAHNNPNSSVPVSGGPEQVVQSDGDGVLVVSKTEGVTPVLHTDSDSIPDDIPPQMSKEEMARMFKWKDQQGSSSDWMQSPQQVEDSSLAAQKRQPTEESLLAEQKRQELARKADDAVLEVEHMRKRGSDLKQKSEHQQANNQHSNTQDESRPKGQVTKEIEEMAEKVRRESRGPSTQEVLFNDDENDDRPYDPNLVCPKCGKQYRVGEIQKLRRHINEFCTGMR